MTALAAAVVAPPAGTAAVRIPPCSVVVWSERGDANECSTGDPSAQMIHLGGADGRAGAVSAAISPHFQLQGHQSGSSSQGKPHPSVCGNLIVRIEQRVSAT